MPQSIYSKKHIQTRRYGIIDLGTNNCRLLIAEVAIDTSNNTIVKPKRTPTKTLHKTFLRRSHVVQLGHKMNDNNTINPMAIKRAINSIQTFQKIMRLHHVDEVHLICTQVCRQAENVVKFTQIVKQETGLNLNIITTKQEGLYAVLACENLLSDAYDQCVVFDIGGGSSEVVVLEKNNMAHQSHDITFNNAFQQKAFFALPIGILTLADKFYCHVNPEKSYHAMLRYVSDLYDTIACESDMLKKNTLSTHYTVQAIGVSGSITRLGAIHKDLKHYNRRAIDGMIISHAQFQKSLKKLKSFTFSKDNRYPYISRSEPKLIFAGCALLQIFMEKISPHSICIADRGLRDGYLINLLRKKQ